MHAAGLLVGPEQPQRQLRIIALHAAVVVGINDAHITLAGNDGFHQGGVVGEHIRGQVGHPAAHDFFGLFFAKTLNHGRHQRLVVDLLGGAQAQAPFPFRVGQIFVARQLAGLQPVLGIHQCASAHGQAIPLLFRVGERIGHIVFQHHGFHRAEQAFFCRIPQITGVHGDQHIRRGAFTLGLQTGGEGRGIVGDVADSHTGGLGVGIEHRFDQVIVAGGIHHQLFIGGRFGTPPQARRHNQGANYDAKHAHIHSLQLFANKNDS